MSNFDSLLERNRAFAATDVRNNLGLRPRTGVFVITCLDPRVDPAVVLGLELGDAPVIRNAGGRVTAAVLADLAFISYMGETMAANGPLFEVAVIHHTQCGTAALANEGFRRAFARRTGVEEDALAPSAVLDPEMTVRADVATILSAPEVSGRITVSGHVYDLDSGLVRTIVAPAAPDANLAFAALILTGGAIGDRYGRRATLAGGLAVFTLATGLAALTMSSGALIALRVLIGAAAAFIFPTTLSIISQTFSYRGARAKAIGAWGATTGVAVATGPIVGGELLANFSWASIFLAMVPVSALGALGAMLVIPGGRAPSTHRLDIRGLTVAAVALGFLVYTIIEAPTAPSSRSSGSRS